MIGSVTLRLAGRDRIIRGGPFDDFQPPAIGVCLEVRATKVGAATMVLPIADFTAPSPATLVSGLQNLLSLMAAAPDLPVYIGCRAGIGRTGMMIAALAKIAGHADPVAWVRTHYHCDAVETEAQRAVIATLDPARIRSRGT